MRRRLAVAVLMLGLVLPAGAVQAAKAFRVDRLGTVSGSRVVVMAVDVRLYEIAAGGGLTRQGEWTRAARSNVAEALAGELSGRGLVAVPFRPSTEPERRALSLQLARLHDLVAEEILAHHVGDTRLPTKAGRFDWTLGPDAGVIAADHDDARYALWLSLGDAYSSGGRQGVNVAAAILGGTIVTGRQVGVLSLVDLPTGDVVYFSRRAVTGGGAADLRTPAGARHALRDLLEDLPR